MDGVNHIVFFIFQPFGAHVSESEGIEVDDGLTETFKALVKRMVVGGADDVDAEFLEGFENVDMRIESGVTRGRDFRICDRRFQLREGNVGLTDYSMEFRIRIDSGEVCTRGRVIHYIKNSRDSDRLRRQGRTGGIVAFADFPACAEHKNQDRQKAHEFFLHNSSLVLHFQFTILINLQILYTGGDKSSTVL